MSVDVLVAGGGPAGLAAAIRAASAGMSVVVIEPRRGVIDKACGEGLLPAGVAALGRLGIRDLDGHPIRGIRYVGGDDLDATADFPSPALGLRRTVLHERLVERAAELGVVRVEDRVRDVVQEPDAVRAGGHVARWLIAADGLHSTVRRGLGVEAPPRRPARFGVRRHFAAAPWSERVEVYFAPGAEAYVTPVSDGEVGVALLFERRTEPNVRFETLLARFPQLVRRLGGRRAVTPAMGAGPFEQRVRRRTAGRVLLVGDAAGYVDALTGEGVALGMATAIAAVDTLVNEASPQSYEATYRGLTRWPFVLTELLVAVARRPALHRPFVRAARGLPSVFEGVLARLGEAPRVEPAAPPPDGLGLHRFVD